MSVEVKYEGRFGNTVFEYVCGRLFALDNGLKLLTPLDGKGIFKTTPHEDGEICSAPIIKVDGGSNLRKTLLDEPRPKAKYILNWFFQAERWYLPREQEIKKFLIPLRPVPRIPNKKDIVIHLRLTDYLRCKMAPHPDWHLDILEREKFDRLHIVTDERHEKYLSYFKKYSPVVQSSSDMADDWYYLTGFDRFICSSGTFSWWAAFYSHASRIYTHQRWVKCYKGDVELGNFPSRSIRVDGPFVDEKEL